MSCRTKKMISFIIILTIALDSLSVSAKPHQTKKAFSALDLDYMQTNTLEDGTSNKQTINECISLQTEPGIYQVLPSTLHVTCGLYIAGPLDAQVDMDFLHFQVECEDKGLMAVLDGWEENGNIFPPEVADEPAKIAHYGNYCGKKKPVKAFTSSGNMAVIQYRFTKLTDRITIRIRFHLNPSPCNAVLRHANGAFILTNHGRGGNCSILAINPEKITINYLNVGIKEDINENLESQGDYVQILGGESIDVNNMREFAHFDATNVDKKEDVEVNCGSVIVRLISSGKRENFLAATATLTDDSFGTFQEDFDRPICRRR